MENQHESTALNSVFEAQKVFFNEQATKDVAYRREMLRKLKFVIKSNEEKLTQAIFEDFGKSVFETYGTEFSMIYKEIDYFIKNLSKLARPKRTKSSVATLPGTDWIYPEPLGTVLVIGAWNYPYQLSLVPMLTALAAGNTCILKPSELPFRAMEVMAELINSNFPPELLYVVKGGVPITSALLEFKFDKIFFTGSPKVGKIVYEAAAKNLVPVTLELGGKSPAIVTRYANLKIAAKRIVWGKFLNAGQTCIAPDYLLVEEAIKSELITEIQQLLESTPYLPDSPHYVRIINEANYKRILGLIQQANIIFGGQYDDELRYIAPTLLDQVTWEDSIMQEEIFGPVLPIMTYSDLDQVYTKIRSGEKPLAAYLFSDDKYEAKQFISEISFGGGCINDTVVHAANHRLPFGGVGGSGIGHYHGRWGFNNFSHQKAIVKRWIWGEANLKYPPYSEKKLSWIRRLL